MSEQDGVNKLLNKMLEKGLDTKTYMQMVDALDGVQGLFIPDRRAELSDTNGSMAWIAEKTARAELREAWRLLPSYGRGSGKELAEIITGLQEQVEAAEQAVTNATAAVGKADGALDSTALSLITQMEHFCIALDVHMPSSWHDPVGRAEVLAKVDNAIARLRLKERMNDVVKDHLFKFLNTLDSGQPRGIGNSESEQKVLATYVDKGLAALEKLKSQAKGKELVIAPEAIDEMLKPVATNPVPEDPGACYDHYAHQAATERLAELKAKKPWKLAVSADILQVRSFDPETGSVDVQTLINPDDFNEEGPSFSIHLIENSQDAWRELRLVPYGDK